MRQHLVIHPHCMNSGRSPQHSLYARWHSHGIADFLSTDLRWPPSTLESCRHGHTTDMRQRSVLRLQAPAAITVPGACSQSGLNVLLPTTLLALGICVFCAYSMASSISFTAAAHEIPFTETHDLGTTLSLMEGRISTIAFPSCSPSRGNAPNVGVADERPSLIYTISRCLMNVVGIRPSAEFPEHRITQLRVT